MAIELETQLRDLTIEAEEDLLGSLMLAVAVLGDEFAPKEVKTLISPSDFLDYSFHGDRARIYEAIVSCDNPDIITVTYELYQTNKLKVNDVSFLQQLLLQVPTSYNYMAYASIVKNLSMVRGGGSKKGGVSLRIR